MARERVAVREFIAAMREFRRPLVGLAAAIMILQTLVAGLGAPAAAQIAAGGLDAGVLCHGNGEPAGSNPTPAVHDCCTFCTNTGPAALACNTGAVTRLEKFQTTRATDIARDIVIVPRAVRAGPSQGPPAIA
jgi:hypothetical protein